MDRASVFETGSLCALATTYAAFARKGVKSWQMKPNSGHKIAPAGEAWAGRVASLATNLGESPPVTRRQTAPARSHSMAVRRYPVRGRRRHRPLTTGTREHCLGRVDSSPGQLFRKVFEGRIRLFWVGTAIKNVSGMFVGLGAVYLVAHVSEAVRGFDEPDVVLLLQNKGSVVHWGNLVLRIVAAQADFISLVGDGDESARTVDRVVALALFCRESRKDRFSAGAIPRSTSGSCQLFDL
jgi:hypothetical protein